MKPTLGQAKRALRVVPKDFRRQFWEWAINTGYFAPKPVPIFLDRLDGRASWNARVFCRDAERLEHGRVYDLEELEADYGFSCWLKGRNPPGKKMRCVRG